MMMFFIVESGVPEPLLQRHRRNSTTTDIKFKIYEGNKFLSKKSQRLIKNCRQKIIDPVDKNLLNLSVKLCKKLNSYLVKLKYIFYK